MRVDIALDGRDAINAVIRKRPDLVFLDIDMPRVSGVVVLKHIKTIDPSIAVVMVAANAQTNLVAEALRNGAFGYVPKPGPTITPRSKWRQGFESDRLSRPLDARAGGPDRGSLIPSLVALFDDPFLRLWTNATMSRCSASGTWNFARVAGA